MKLKIGDSVGKKGTNNDKDVKLIKALLNVYARKKGKTTFSIDTSTNDAFELAIEDFQKNHQKIQTPDAQVTSSNSASFKSLVSFMKSTRTTATITKPSKGIVTWEAEGNEGGRFHSRVLHIPSLVSGLTIGRGYDMKNRSSSAIKKDMVNANIDGVKSGIVAKAAGLSGSKAEQFIIDSDLLDFEIDASSQLKLFELVYKDYAATVKRICGKKTVEDKYGQVDWDKLDEDIITILVDLAFRGDYHGTSRKIIQKSVADNDFAEFKKHIINKKNWGLWPKDRFERRKEFLDEASKRKPKTANSALKKSPTEGAKISIKQAIGTPE